MTVASEGADLVEVGSLPAFWRAALDARRDLVLDLRATVTRRSTRDRGDREVQRAVQALNGALDVHRVLQRRPDLWATTLGAYVRTWARDVETWRALVEDAAAGRLPPQVERRLEPALTGLRPEQQDAPEDETALVMP
jgi:hypothetical protein